MTQTLRGLLQSAATPIAKMTHIVGSGAKNPTDRVFFQNSATPLATNAIDSASTASSDRGWSSPTFNVSGTDAGHRPRRRVRRKGHDELGPHEHDTERLPRWSAMIFSATVADTDADGQPDKLEDTNNMKLPDGTLLPDLKAMGATKNHKDVFLELGALYADPGTTYGVGPAAVVDGAGHNHLPTPAVIKLLGDAYKNAPIMNLDGLPGIRLHVDAGPNSPIVERGRVSGAPGACARRRIDQGSRLRSTTGRPTASSRRTLAR